jgi:hypothetical protein
MFYRKSRHFYEAFTEIQKNNKKINQNFTVNILSCIHAVKS